MSVRKPRPMAREIVLEKKAWFLCKFLSRTLDEDIYERIRYHISVCKGVKTKIKLSSKGLSSGYKTGSFRHLNHKLPYEFFPLDFVESLQQDIMFVNVLLGVFRMQSVPDLQYEIVAYKFADNTAVKQMQDAFHMLTGSEPVQTLRSHAGSTMTLVPAGPASYRANTLQQQPRGDRWETRDRLGASESVLNSEVRTHNTGRREISGRRMILDSEGSWSEGSSIIEDSGTVFRTADGTVVAPSAGSTYGRPRNNITLTSVDSYDVPSTRGRYDVVDSVNHKIYSRPPSERGRGYDQPPAQSSRYQSNDTGSYYGRSRSVDQSRGYDTYGSRGHYTNGSRGYDTYASRGEDAYGSRGDYTYGSRGNGAVTPRNGYWTSDNKSDVISVRSQSSYLLSPKFKKVYAPRSTPQGGQGAYAASTIQSVRPRAYAGSEIRRDGRW